jgi:hypothetical protein
MGWVQHVSPFFDHIDAQVLLNVHFDEIKHRLLPGISDELNHLRQTIKMAKIEHSLAHSIFPANFRNIQIWVLQLRLINLVL